ncbi:MAG: HupE/UreJ family protein [Synechococcus sp.]
MPVLFAHLMETGFGGFYDGIAHLFITPTDLLLVVGLALLAGQQGPAAGRRLLAVLPLTWLIGGAIGQILAFDGALVGLSTGLVTLVGVLVAMARPLPPRAFVLGVGLSGLLFGLINGFTMPSQAGGVSLDLFGVVTAIAVVAVLISAQVAVIQRQALCIAVQVLGSWIAAAGVLSLGLLARG